MKKDQLIKNPIPPRDLFLADIKEFLSQVSNFREQTGSILTNHRKELILKPELEKCIEYALTAEYLPKLVQDYYDKNHYYIETDSRFLQRVLDKYSLGKILEYSSIDTKKFAKENITAIYIVKSSKGGFLLLETPDVKVAKECLKLCEKLRGADSVKPIGTSHTYDKYFHIYQSLP